MGAFKIKVPVRVLAWIVAVIIVVLNVKLILEELGKFYAYLGEGQLLIKMLVVVAVGFCAVLLLYVSIEPFISRSRKEKAFVPHGKAIELTGIERRAYRHIALTIDFSKHDESTIQHALSLGGKEATYLLIHVVESAGAIRMKEEIQDQETAYDRQNLEKYKSELEALGYYADVELGFGKSASVITTIINRRNIDLLVMGAHGHKGLKDLLFGTTVDKVRHNVHVPVLIVK
jgi:manganese transport protein